ncbi:MAG: HD domain-containing protein [Ignavibacteriaceae bacterium]|nr:HD domain-containing protein [Ignavibacteriaceae bacterium]
MNSEILKKVEEHINNIFRTNDTSNNFYHNLAHTIEVVGVITEIGRSVGLTDEEIEIAKISALFHDVGYVELCEGHENVSIRYAKDFLQKNYYPEDKIEKVIGCINATRIPHKPKNKLEEVICDADLIHLGTKHFKEKNLLLRMELEKKGNKVFSDEEWYKINIKFMKDHHFFTEYARNQYGETKNENVFKMEKKYLKELKKSNGKNRSEEKIMSDHEINPAKKDKEPKTERGVETMFRNVMRTHVDFSSMADNKANIMISINTLIITIIVSLMLRKLEANPHLIIPTLILTLTSLSTLIYAIIVTRPKITSGRFTKEDIEHKRANLMFFGNFYNMKLEDFSWGMKQVINDKDYLYESMIKDFYYLGQILGLKYKNLRICYNIFMYGIIISVLAFAIAFLFYPGATNLGPVIE